MLFRSETRAPERRTDRSRPVERPVRTNNITTDEKKAFNKMLEDLIGTRGAYILDKGLSILGKIPISELESTVKSLNNAAYAVIFDGNITTELVTVSERSNVKYLVGMGGKVSGTGRTKILTPENLS